MYSQTSINLSGRASPISWIAPLMLVALATLLSSHTVNAQRLSVGTLDPNYIAQGESKELTLFGSGFNADVELSFTAGSDPNSGVSVSGTPELVLGADAGDGRGDRIVFTATAAAGTPTGPRNLEVIVGSDSRVKIAALNIRPGEGAAASAGDPSDPSGSDTGGSTDDGGRRGSLYDSLPPREDGQINAVTRASPPKGERGGQVNLWIEGREFPADLQLKFDPDKIEPAYDSNGEPIRPQVYRNTSDTGGEMDGFLFYARISPDTPLGPISITLQSPSTGASYVAADIFEIVPEGEGLIFDMSGAETIGSVTSASPAAVRAGRNTAMWILGTDFNIMSDVTFSNLSIQPVRDSEIVIGAQNAVGYDGVRSYLQIPASAAPGPVSVTITNPNGSSAEGIDLFEIVAPASVEGQGGELGGIAGVCEDTDPNLIISEILGSDPAEVSVGSEVEIKIFARGLACSASLMIDTQGIDILSPPQVFQDQSDLGRRFFQMRIKVNSNAILGPRNVTILNPNGSSKSRPDTFTVISSASFGTGASCDQHRAGQARGQELALLILTLLAMVGVARIRRRAC